MKFLYQYYCSLSKHLGQRWQVKLPSSEQNCLQIQNTVLCRKRQAYIYRGLLQTCHKNIDLSNMGRGALECHMKGKKHSEDSGTNSGTIKSFFKEQGDHLHQLKECSYRSKSLVVIMQLRMLKSIRL